MVFIMQFISVCLLSGHTLQITIQIIAVYPANTIHSYKYGIAYIKKTTVSRSQKMTLSRNVTKYGIFETH